MNELLVEFGNNLRAERSRKNLSQEKLAEMIGIQTHHVSKIERGLVDIKISTLISILKALDLSFDKLFEIKQ